MLNSLLTKNKDLALVGGMLLILLILFAPIPSVALDLAIIINFGLALTVLFLTFYVRKPIDFSTFPSLLLITTLFRLSLNVAATRLILTGGEAGDVIGSIGEFAVSGNFIVGLVVFFILVVVQYVVVTSGAQRVSEVAARFTLDSMPGQQMSIDADLNMGLIDQNEALRRREELEKEASFYGAMDGASKFVKGDAIAGIIILLIDIVAGWIIGVMQMGMTWNEALQHFTLLTIGDGIATQLPALVIATATGIIVTRSSADRELSTEVFAQLGSIPRILLMVSGILFCLMLLPGMPKWPILLLGLVCLYGWWSLRGYVGEGADAESEIIEETEAEDDSISQTFPALEIHFGSELSAAWKTERDDILERIGQLRETHQKRFGIGFPNVRFVDGQGLGDTSYQFHLLGTRYASGEVYPDRQLAIASQDVDTDLPGEKTHDPAFGMPAVWIDPEVADAARASGHTVIDPISVVITHFGELMSREASTLLTRARMSRILDEVRQRQPGLVEDIVPNTLSISDVQKVMQNLLDEAVPIGNVDLILEHLADLSRNERDADALTELLRHKLAYVICDALRGQHDDLSVLSLDPRLENRIQAGMGGRGPGDIMMDPKIAQHLLGSLTQLATAMQNEGRQPVLLCGASLRRPIRALVRRPLPRLAVISTSEIPPNIRLSSFDVVKPDEPDPSERPKLSDATL